MSTGSIASFGLGAEQKPMVTREQYDQARAVLNILAPGYYVKCAGPCQGWYYGGNYIKRAGDTGPLCEGCA